MRKYTHFFYTTRSYILLLPHCYCVHKILTLLLSFFWNYIYKLGFSLSSLSSFLHRIHFYHINVLWWLWRNYAIIPLTAALELLKSFMGLLFSFAPLDHHHHSRHHYHSFSNSISTLFTIHTVSFEPEKKKRKRIRWLMTMTNYIHPELHVKVVSFDTWSTTTTVYQSFLLFTHNALNM